MLLIKAHNTPVAHCEGQQKRDVERKANFATSKENEESNKRSEKILG